MNKERRANLFWLVVAVLLATSLLFVVLDHRVPAFEVVELEWTQGENAVEVTGAILSRSRIPSVVTVELSLDPYSGGDAESLVSYYGERDYAFAVPADQRFQFQASIPIVRKTRAPLHVLARIKKVEADLTNENGP
jgi:hypothetical protein